MYESIQDAATALDNSGVVEWFYQAGFDTDEKELQVHEWMWRNDATPEEAAHHFGVE